MRRIAQGTYNDVTEQSVMLSPRTLLTGPKQIARLERQYRSLSEDLQNALENLNRTKDSYISALQTLEQAEEYIQLLTRKSKYAITLLNTAKTNSQYLGQAESAIEEIIGGAVESATLPKTSGTRSMTRMSSGITTSQVQQAPNLQQQTMIAQRINVLQTQLRTFANEMYRQYNLHKQRATAMEGQYNMSKAAYAKTRELFFQMQTEISSLNSNLSGWNERLVEYYAPESGV